jgi:hypothetical protein
VFLWDVTWWPQNDKAKCTRGRCAPLESVAGALDPSYHVSCFSSDAGVYLVIVSVIVVLTSVCYVPYMARCATAPA